MKTNQRTILRRIGLTLAVATAVTAQLVSIAPRSAYAEAKDTNKPVITKPIEKLSDKLKEKKPGDAVPIPFDPGIPIPKKPDLPIKPFDPKSPDLPLNPDLLKKPDLSVEGLSLQLEAPGQCDPSGTTIIAEIKNEGDGKAGSFAVRLTVDGNDLENGFAEIDGLAVGANKYVTFDGVALPQGAHSLKVIADANDETSDPKLNNNSKSTNFNCTSVAAPTVDVEVSSFVVEGKHDEVSDCDPGKNAIYAIVRNKGGAAAGPFAVRMLADGSEPDDGTEMVGGLEPGQETVVQLQKVKLNEGAHTLRVIADPDYALGDPDTSNNYQEQSVSCVKE